MPESELLKEMRDDIKTLLSTSAVNGERIGHLEDAVTKLDEKFDARDEKIYMIESNMVTEGDCRATRNRVEKQGDKKRTNWIAVIAVCAAFVAAGGTVAMAVTIHNSNEAGNATSNQSSKP